MEISQKELELKKYEARLSLWKTGIIGGSVTVITAIISTLVSVYISSAETESKFEIEKLKAKSSLELNQTTKDNEFVGQFLDKAVTDKKEEVKMVSSTLATLESAKTHDPSSLALPTTSINFQKEYDNKRTDELALSRLGKQAFNAKEYEWAVKIFTQADAVKASGVWQSDYPFFIGALYALNKSDDAKLAEEDLINRINSSISKGYGYLSNDPPLGFLIKNLGDVKKSLPGKSSQLDELIDKIIELKKMAK